MRKLFNKINHGFSRLFRILLFFISSFLIIYFFPKTGKFKYDFENSRPWQYENLYAPFDFVIKKTDKEINDELLDVRLKTPIYFSIDTIFNSKVDNIFLADSLFSKNDKTSIDQVKKTFVDIIKNIKDIRYCFLHQANKMIQESISTQINNRNKKIIFPSSLKNFGNTSSATVPITICSNFANKKIPGNLYYVGLEWVYLFLQLF